MKKLLFIVISIFFLSNVSFAQKWEDCCWKKLKSGLEINILKKGKGKKIKNGDTIFVVWILFDCKTGEILYNSKNSLPNGNRWIVGDESDKYLARGYIEAVRKLKSGGQAYVKIPPNLAFGEEGYLGQKTLCCYIEII